MDKGSKIFRGWFILGMIVTLIAAIVESHNSGVYQLTFANVIVVAIVPLGLLGIATIYYGGVYPVIAKKEAEKAAHTQQKTGS
ncbi:MAG: hypothetical protein OWS74_01080 [Firmicutes bacterium]|nr:hypothetical protein [Bacillota bacterium]